MKTPDIAGFIDANVEKEIKKYEELFGVKIEVRDSAEAGRGQTT
jgi:hypothetical protein